MVDDRGGPFVTIARHDPDLKRSAALTLHGLSAPDRQWLLAQLDPQHRTQLQILLDELVLLGIPSDPELVQVAIHRPKTTASQEESGRGVMVGTPESLAAILGGEPDSMIGIVLSTIDRSHAQEVLQKMPADRLGPIRAAIDRAPKSATALNEAILEAIRHRLVRNEKDLDITP